MAKQSDNLIDLEFIGEKVLWFLRLTPEQFKAYFQAHPHDAFYSVRSPKGDRMVMIGREAGQRFWRVAERHLASHRHHKVRTHVSAFVEQLRVAFAQLFLEEARDMTESAAARWVSIAYRATAKRHEAATHYIPCALIFSDSLEKFEVGPVTFLHRREFFRLHGAEIEQLRTTMRDRHRKQAENAIAKGAQYVGPPEQSAQWGNQATDALLEHFNRYHWFAVVAIPASDREVSYDRALFATRGALNIVKLLLGSHYTDRLRAADDFGPAGRATKLRRGTNGELSISFSLTPVDNAVGDEWLKDLNRAGRFFSVPSRVLTLCVDFELPPPLCARYLDALSWFGDAISERAPAAKIVKFVTAIERICGTGLEKFSSGEERGVVDIVTTRAGILLSVLTETPFERARDDIKKIYDCRSKLLHGSLSPFDGKVLTQVSKSDELTRLILTAAIDYYNGIGLEDFKNTDKGLRAHFLKLEKWNADGRPG